MNRLDEIERWISAADEVCPQCGAYVMASEKADADWHALVAVAREAKNVCEVYSRSDQYSPSIECLIIALAPLLASTVPDARDALDEVAQMDHEDAQRGEGGR
jgi:hypothetical protein